MTIVVSNVSIDIKTNVMTFKLDNKEEFQYNGKIKTFFKRDKLKNRFVKVSDNIIEKRIRETILMQLKSYKEYNDKVEPNKK